MRVDSRNNPSRDRPRRESRHAYSRRELRNEVEQRIIHLPSWRNGATWMYSG